MDTTAIVNVYMTRPQSLACVSLGQWFCNAMAIRDPELLRAEGAQAKRLFVEMGWTSEPGILDVLKDYNHRNEEGPL